MKIKTLEELIDILDDDPKVAYEQEPWHLIRRAHAVVKAAERLAGDLDRRWTKDHPHRKEYLDPLLAALTKLQQSNSGDRV